MDQVSKFLGDSCVHERHFQRRLRQSVKFGMEKIATCRPATAGNNQAAPHNGDPEILAHNLHLLVSKMLPRLIRVMRLLSVPGRGSKGRSNLINLTRAIATGGVAVTELQPMQPAAALMTNEECRAAGEKALH